MDINLRIWICFSFIYLGYINFSESHKGIVDKFQPPLIPGDGITIMGERKSKRQTAQIRLFAPRGSCPNSGPNDQCNPFILAIKYTGKTTLQLKSYYYNKVKRGRSTVATGSKTVSVRDSNSLNIYIEIGNDDFKIYMDDNDDPSYNVTNELGVNRIETLRVYSAYNYSNHIISTDASVSPLWQLNQRDCGIRTVSGNSRPNTLRIVGGMRADPGQYPWQIAIRQKERYAMGFGHHCGGTLIHPCWVLTAAHCVTRFVEINCDMYEVRVGDYYNGNNQDIVQGLRDAGKYGEDQQTFEIDEIHRHENYTTIPSAQNDIALVKLKQIDGKCARMGEYVRCACLPEPQVNFPIASSCWVSGWGAMNWTHYINDYPQVLRHGQVNILNTTRCRNYYGMDNGVWKIREGMFCSNGKGVDTCQGDSGGPLVCPMVRPDSPHETFVIWGLTSWGEGCGDATKPGVYTKVKDFIPWIVSTMQKTRTQKHKCSRLQTWSKK